MPIWMMNDFIILSQVQLMNYVKVLSQGVLKNESTIDAKWENSLLCIFVYYIWTYHAQYKRFLFS